MKMKILVSMVLWCQSLVLARPQNNFQRFSETARSSQTFSTGTKTQLNQQTFSAGQDAFFQSLDTSLDNLFPTTGLGSTGFDDYSDTFLDPSLLLDASFDVFSSSNGEFCDYFCQQAKRLNDQSLNQFEKDLRSFGAQFVNTRTNVGAFIPQNTGVPDVFVYDVTNKRPTTNDLSFTSFTNKNIRPNSFDKPKPGTAPSNPTFTRQTITTQRPRVTPIAIFNRPSSTTTARAPLKTTRRRTTPRTTIPTTTISTTTVTPIPISPTTEKEKDKNSNGVSIPLETTTQKNTKIKFTFNGKTIG
eukprot:GFUD01073733.1.p1 GENE.GFUD01073733.1~~GFUD01073733.1.p1  ORF type:complete len:301 (-),score=43.94 GFUD01073733.1:50-952(-)